MTFRLLTFAAAALGSGILLYPAAASAARQDTFSLAALPVGVTMTPPQPRQRGGAVLPGLLNDAAGMTLYTYDGDEKGKARCLDACAAAWPPFKAEGDAPNGDWSVVTRTDRIKQWAYKGKPLYLSRKDAVPGDMKGNGADGQWHAATYQPAADEWFAPGGISLRQNARANGDLLVDHRGMSLYVRDRKAGACKDDCLKTWQPVTAGELAKAVGEWSVAERDDGRRQWAYKGYPVYRFIGDTRPGEVNGVLFDSRWQAATVGRYFAPADVRQVKSGNNVTLATADGRTLYARERFQYGQGSFHAEDGGTSSVAIGRQIGTDACQGKPCPDFWKPFAAAPNAQPGGYWSILQRPDGTRQWAYQGYALYVNAQDKKPGDMNGRDVFDYTDGMNAFFWRIARP